MGKLRRNIQEEMDEDFMMDFNVTDPPVFARKSAPPPDPSTQQDQAEGMEEQEDQDVRQENSAGMTTKASEAFSAFPSPTNCSTPSSSILNSSIDNSRNRTRDEPMEMDETSTPKPPSKPGDKENCKDNGKRTRSRSKAKRNIVKDKMKADETTESRPDIGKLLAGLEPQPVTTRNGQDQGQEETPNVGNSGLAPNKEIVGTKKQKPKYTKAEQAAPISGASGQGGDSPRNPPPLPRDSPTLLPPPPPPPETCEDASAGVETNIAGHSKRGGSKNRGGSQRTAGRVPRASKEKERPEPGTGDVIGPGSKGKSNASVVRHDPSQQQQHQQQHQQHQQQQQQQQQSSYNKKPGGQAESVCLDVTSHRFLPDDDRKLGILRRRVIGDPESIQLPGSGTRVTHDLPTVFSNEITGVELLQAPGSAEACMASDARFAVIAEFATVDRPDTTTYHTIQKREAITFLLMYRPEQSRGKKRWEFPPLQFCQDYINNLLSKMFADDLPGGLAYARTGKWGLVQTIVLHSGDMPALEDFRRYVATWAYKGHHFDTYPRDVAISKPSLSILLRASMKTFQTDIIPKVLFNRNRSLLAGSLRVVSTTFFTAADMSHKGESKEHWRSVELIGDEQMMRCLRFIPESRPLLLGYDAVQIRGGLRPQESSPFQTGSKRSWSDIQPAASPLLADPRDPQQHHQQQQQQQQQYGNDEHGYRGAKRGRPFRGGRRGRGRFPRNF